jgi:tetraacyldisaccharide-1-P 4'-kinase
LQAAQRRGAAAETCAAHKGILIASAVVVRCRRHCSSSCRRGDDGDGVERLRAGRIAAFAGIGNPSAFRTSLENLSANLAGFRPFPDHHAYTATDLHALHDWAAGLHADLVVTTLKDLVKLRVDRLGDIPLFALEIAMEILPSGDSSDRLEALLESAVARAAAAAVVASVAAADKAASAAASSETLRRRSAY